MRRGRMRGMRRHRMGFRRGRMHGQGMWRRRYWGPFYWWPRMFLMGSFLYLLFGSRPYKLHQDDVTVIERETGRDAGDMTEEELIAAMRRLGIKKLEITPDEREAIERT